MSHSEVINPPTKHSTLDIQRSIKQLPTVEFTDSHLSAIARAYYSDENFARGEGGIDLWRVYNLFTGANKSSYIDTFLDRSLGATTLVRGIAQALDSPNEYSWFIERCCGVEWSQNPHFTKRCICL